MATIEERYGNPQELYSFETDREEQWFKCGQVDGATEQREIDLEKACKFLHEIGAFSTLSFYDNEGVSQEVYEEMFRKAMMEE